jgi:hypothetical protein
VLFGNQIRERRVSIFVDYVGSIIILAASHVQIALTTLRHHIALVPPEGHMLAFDEMTRVYVLPVILLAARNAGNLPTAVSVFHPREPRKDTVQLVH